MNLLANTRTLSADLSNEFIDGVHRPIQKVLLFVSAPIGVIVFSYLSWTNPVWQSYVLLVGIFAVLTCWFAGYRFLTQGRNSLSVACLTIPVVVQGTLVMVLYDGYATASIWPMLVTTVYVGLYSRRLLFICGLLMIIAPILGVTVKQFDIYSLVSVETSHKPLPLVLMGASSGLVLGLLLKRSLALRAGIFQSLGNSNREQKKVLRTIRDIQPEIDGAVQEIKQISSKLAAQSAEQAASTSQISATVEIIKENAEHTLANAEQTQIISQQTRASSLKSSERLAKIEKSFDRVVATISASAEEVTALTKQMERIEEVLAFNRKIGENIKVLSINAAIEADRAGDLGHGFGAVAAEFRDMIRDTEKNLAYSSDLLQNIRDQARESSLIIIEGSQGLSGYFNELREASMALKQNTDRFYRTATQVKEITRAAKEQQESVAEVSDTMDQIDRASFDLKDSANILLQVVDSIVLFQQRLDEVLQIG